MNNEKGKTRLVDAVKVRESGGRSLEVTIPEKIVKSMKLQKDDVLLVLEDKISNSYIMYIDPKKASITTQPLSDDLSLSSPFSQEELEELKKQLKNKE